MDSIATNYFVIFRNGGGSTMCLTLQTTSPINLELVFFVNEVGEAFAVHKSRPSGSTVMMVDGVFKQAFF